MKKLSLRIIIPMSILALLGFLWLAFPNQVSVNPFSSRGATIWEKGNSTDRLQIADIDMPLLFERPVRGRLKKVVLADIHLIYGGKGLSYQRHDWRGRRPDYPSFTINGENYLSVETLQLNGARAPEVVYENFRHIVKIDGAEYVVIPKELIDAYEKAWKAKNKNPRMYEKLEIFIEWLNAASLAELRENNPFWLLGYDGISSDHPQKAAEIKEMVLPKRREDFLFRHPSILEFTFVDQELLEEEDIVGELPQGVTLAYGYSVEKEGIPFNRSSFIYDGKKWYVLIGPVGRLKP